MGLGFGYLAGRVVTVPGSTQLWDIAAQPIATALAGAGAIGAGYLAFHNGEKSRALDTEHHKDTSERDREADLRKRYTTAASQLADESPAIREAGTYALAALADDWIRFGESTSQEELAYSEIQVCVNLLCSYLRANRRMLDEDSRGPDQRVFDAGEFSVRTSIAMVLGDRAPQWREQGQKWRSVDRLNNNRSLRVDLSGANLADMKLARLDFSGAEIQGADLSHANLAGANFSGAKMHRVKLTRKPFMIESNLSDARLGGADLSGARLHKVNLTRAWLINANLSGADLRTAIIDSSERSLMAAIWDEGTIWPEGFEIPTRPSSFEVIGDL
ncbi:pentapeptide repeat-containing protein [Rhodococcus sp. T7]|uniref:pentapeptide repeat-containing protein n=1 Tax=Rhodococcus sp. T7 TaxID=627444 RepID=UPI001357D3F4|nr:pentapeptide repeat-containing protein [Rhodococcus sp. T7]